MQSQPEIDCRQKGYNGLLGAVFKDRYEIVKALSKGAHGHIFEIEDLRENKKLAMKLQDDQDMATTEIATMKKIT